MYLLIWGDVSQKVPRISQKWLLIGFVAKDPRSHFIEGTILALHCIRYFVKNYHEYFNQIIENCPDNFMYSLLSIKVTVSTY